jgi:hypothetical protein
MSNDARKTSELAIATTLSANDRVVILKDPDSSPSTKTITANNLANSVLNVMRYASPTLAGVVKIDNSSIVISNTGVITSVAANLVAAPSDIIPAANNTYSLGNSSMQWKNLNFSGDLRGSSVFTITTPNISNSNTKYSESYYDQAGYWGAYTELDIPNGNSSWAWIETNLTDINNPHVFIENQNNNGDNYRWTFENNGNFNVPNNSTITSNTGAFAISNVQLISFSNNDIVIGNLMGPVLLGNNSLITVAGEQTNTSLAISGTLLYPGINQLFVQRLNFSNNNYNTYAVTLDGDAKTFTSDVTIVSRQDIVANNNIYFKGNIYDELNRPIYNPNALDINTDGGTSLAIFSKTDPAFDGGSGQSIFGIYETALDGGVSFNNKHSASYIDGGGANQF